MRVSRACTLLLVVPLWMMGSAQAKFSHIEFGAGGGFSAPQGRMGNNVDTGWNFVLRGGYKTSTQAGSDLPPAGVSLDHDFNYNHWDLNRTALNRLGEPCDFFFGFCFPVTVGVDHVVASATTYRVGVNGGGGIEFRLGESDLKAFGEARYSRMFTTHGADFTFVPVTFGLRW